MTSLWPHPWSGPIAATLITCNILSDLKSISLLASTNIKTLAVFMHSCFKKKKKKVCIIIGSPKLEKTSPIIQFNRPPTTKSPSNLSTDRLSQILPCLGEENKASRSFKVLWLGAASAYTKMYLQQLYYKPQKFIRVLKSLLSGFLYPALLNVHTPQTTLETLC